MNDIWKRELAVDDEIGRDEQVGHRGYWAKITVFIDEYVPGRGRPIR